jgi:hypothetical protein
MLTGHVKVGISFRIFSCLPISGSFIESSGTRIGVCIICGNGQRGWGWLILWLWLRLIFSESSELNTIDRVDLEGEE